MDFGLDNVSFENAMDALKNGIEIILKKVKIESKSHGTD